MKSIIIAVLWGVFIGTGLAWAQAVQYKRAESYMPDVVRITREMPDRGRVCVEPLTGGIDTCRTIADLRKWVQDTKGAK